MQWSNNIDAKAIYDDGGAKASNLKNMKKIECEMIEQNCVQQHHQHL
jgi:hypothetical protein